MRRAAMLLLLVVLLVGSGYGLGTYTGDRFKQFLRRPAEASETAREVPVVTSRSALGYLQPAEGVISLGGVPGDRIEHLYVTPGKTIAKGDSLVRFASYKERQRELAVATKQLLAARFRESALNAAEKAKLAELDQQRDKARMLAELKSRRDKIQLPPLEEQYALADSVYQALRRLDPSRAELSQQDLRKARVEMLAALASLETARAARQAAADERRLEEQTFEAMRKAAEAEFNLSRASLGLEMLEEQKKLAELRLERALLKADKDGIVLRILAHEGDTVGQEPILQLAAVKQMIVVAKVDVNDVGLLASWISPPRSVVQAHIKGSGLPQTLTGWLTERTSIDRMVSRASLTGYSPRGDADRRIIEVRVQLDEESSALAANYIGHEVQVTFTPATKP